MRLVRRARSQKEVEVKERLKKIARRKGEGDAVPGRGHPRCFGPLARVGPTRRRTELVDPNRPREDIPEAGTARSRVEKLTAMECRMLPSRRPNNIAMLLIFLLVRDPYR